MYNNMEEYIGRQGITHKITGVPSGGGIGRGLATVHAGLDGSRPVEQDLADSQVKKKDCEYNGIFRFFLILEKKEKGKENQTFSLGGWEEGKKMNGGLAVEPSTKVTEVLAGTLLCLRFKYFL